MVRRSQAGFNSGKAGGTLQYAEKQDGVILYTEEEYKRRIKELAPVAKKIIERKTPDEAREMVSGMSPEDAYIVGIWLEKMLQFDDFTRALSGIVVKIQNSEVSDEFDLN